MQIGDKIPKFTKSGKIELMQNHKLLTLRVVPKQAGLYSEFKLLRKQKLL